MSTEEFDLIAEFREDEGKGASRRLRRAGMVPAIIYGAGRPPRMLAFDHNKVLQQLDNESFYSSVLAIKVGDKSQAAILKDLQRHPSKRQILHMDFQRIVEDEEIRMNVPLHFVGEDKAPGVKLEGGKVFHLINEVEVVCLPKNLPEFIEVDISEMKLDEMLHMSDLKLPAGIEVPELAQGPEHDQAIVSVQKVKRAAVEEESTDESADEEASDADEASED